MNLTQRREAIRKQMAAEGMDLLFAFHDGTHFIEKPDPVTIICRFQGRWAIAP